MAATNVVLRCLRGWQRGAFTRVPTPLIRYASTSVNDGKQPPLPPDTVIPVPPYKPREGEDDATKRARLLYQSRKRGILENGLLLSSFAQDNLPKFTREQLDMYDSLINQLDNDWDLYYWMTGKEKVPERFDNVIMDLLKDHAKNVNKEKRYSQPELYQ